MLLGGRLLGALLELVLLPHGGPVKLWGELAKLFWSRPLLLVPHEVVGFGELLIAF